MQNLKREYTVKDANGVEVVLKNYDEALKFIQKYVKYDNWVTRMIGKTPLQEYFNFNSLDSVLKDKEAIDFGLVDIKAIQALLNSNISTNKIAIGTNISASAISNHRHKKTNLSNMTVDIAVKLTKFALENNVYSRGLAIYTKKTFKCYKCGYELLGGVYCPICGAKVDV